MSFFFSPSHTKHTSPSSGRLLPLMGGGSCSQFTSILFGALGLKRENPFASTTIVTFKLVRFHCLNCAWPEHFLQVNLQSGFSPMKFGPKLKWISRTEDFTIILWHGHHSPLCKVNCDYKYSLTLNIHWKGWCWSWSFNTLATWHEESTHWKRLIILEKNWRQKKITAEGEMVR